MEKNSDNLKRGFKYAVLLILLWWAINNFNIIGNFTSNIINIVFPFILGGVLAFIINIPMIFFERKLSKIKNKKLLRGISIIISILVVICIIYLIINLILPELINIINLLIDNIPYYVGEITRLVEDSSISNNLENINLDTETIKEQLLGIIPNLLTSSISIVGTIVNGLSNTVIALIFAIYVLMSKEKINNALQQILYAYLKEKRADNIINIGKISNKTFKSFLTVQCLEATILGTLCVIGMLILNIPYAVPIGVLIGVTALIPVVGAFIGIIVGTILIVAVEPVKVITFIIFVLILQQIEGNVIYPRVVGESIGLPAILVLMAVTIGGNMFGVLGMLISVPIASIIFILIKKDIKIKIDFKGEIN